jgi:hypothetical protein
MCPHLFTGRKQDNEAVQHPKRADFPTPSSDGPKENDNWASKWNILCNPKAKF